jgi:2-iminobutanoate/2-iminopropanoate deaminase
MQTDKKVIVAEKAPKAIGPYSHAILSGGYVFTSGQLGMDPNTGVLIEGGVEAEARQALKNLGAVLQAAGCDYNHVVKTVVFLKDINDFARVNSIYAEFFTEKPPARSAVQVAALPKGGAIEIEAIAAIPA